jgi:flagella basal body P-ring formation protein FlgA
MQESHVEAALFPAGSKRTRPTPRIAWASRIAWAAALVVLAIAHVAAALPAVISPREAIRRAVEQRFGGHIAVEVTSLDTDVTAAATLMAVPDPAARTGRPVRFELVAGGVRVGAAVAAVTVRARYVQATRAIARGETIAPGDIELVEGDLQDAAFLRLPTVDDLVGLRARRDIAPGEPLTSAVVDVPPVVKSGDHVIVSVTIGPVQAEGPGIASGSGQVGDRIRVMQAGTRRLIPVRITGKGRVEVVQ